MLAEQASPIAVREVATERIREPEVIARFGQRLGEQRDHAVAVRVGAVGHGVAVGRILAIVADQAGGRIDDPLDEILDLALEPGAVPLHEVRRAGRPQRPEEQGQ